ncbi:LacI family DNA-binding transcriptional regulator [Microlunatus sp. Gsoil 973]|uniref:LacI family DNA-binding transcriptional regulator n=1 Tax=Microlunatus sp. Gsoil 973 TaxID=2672569 RepID=UPI0012B483FA|nr:LacI family DNA-binding transcriptional regulator [Microlunatus sp. Gsoil 973]QGN33292.1 LacI family DNA-binding transcriptional regulator [Microlunatus sp. Gsoil 973]
MERVTIDDLAARLGLSRASVSYALNGRPGVAEETRIRVLELARELGWQPSVSARSLSRSRADAIGIVLNRRPEDLGSEPFYMGLLSGIEAALSDAGTSLMVRFVPDGDSEAAVYRRWTAERRVDGVILTDLRLDDPRPSLLDDLSLPYLVHSGHLTERGWRFDNDQEATILVDHLAALGHARIAHISGPTDLLHEVERREAVVSGAEQHGMRASTFAGDYSLEGGHELTARLLGRRDAPTAIIYSNDLMAVGGLTALREAGRTDIAVVSWDDSLLCRTAWPGISALQRDPYHAGRSTATQLLARVRRPGDPPVGVVPPKPSELVVRDSSHPPR